MNTRYPSCVVFALIFLTGICRAQVTPAICKTFGQSFKDEALSHQAHQMEMVAFEKKVCSCLTAQPAQLRGHSCSYKVGQLREQASKILLDLAQQWGKRDGVAFLLLSNEILFVLAAEPSTVEGFVSNTNTYQSWLNELATASFTDFGNHGKLLDQARKDTISSLKSQAAAHELLGVLKNARVRVID